MGLLDQAQGGGPMTPQLAEAAAGAGAPPPDAGAPAPGSAPGEGAPPAAPAGPEPTAAAPAAPPQGAAGSPAEGLPFQQAAPEVQQEYERAMKAVVKVLYSNDKTANAVVDQVDPNDPVSSIAKVSMLFIKELDRKVNMHEEVIAEVTQEATNRIAELAEARHRIDVTPTDMEEIIGATWEGIQTMFGGDPQQFTETVQNLDPNTMSALKQQQDQILNRAKY